MPEVDAVYAAGEDLPGFDWHAPLMSLPRIFETTFATVPNAVPYLAAPSSRASTRGARIIGIAWAGSPSHRRDRFRSLPAGIARELALLLIRVPDVRVVSLQLGARRDELADLIEPVLAEGADFAEAADAVAGLALVVAVDTAIVHLAGALASPAIVLLAHQPDFRWLLDREETPWYPTLRLLRQRSSGDWASALREIPRALRALLPGLTPPPFGR
jgi:ADP-heptose:LPS heptosyltransferase